MKLPDATRRFFIGASAVAILAAGDLALWTQPVIGGVPAISLSQPAVLSPVTEGQTAGEALAGWTEPAFAATNGKAVGRYDHLQVDLGDGIWLDCSPKLILARGWRVAVRHVAHAKGAVTFEGRCPDLVVGAATGDIHVGLSTPVGGGSFFIDVADGDYGPFTVAAKIGTVRVPLTSGTTVIGGRTVRHDVAGITVASSQQLKDALAAAAKAGDTIHLRPGPKYTTAQADWSGAADGRTGMLNVQPSGDVAEAGRIHTDPITLVSPANGADMRLVLKRLEGNLTTANVPWGYRVYGKSTQNAYGALHPAAAIGFAQKVWMTLGARGSGTVTTGTRLEDCHVEGNATNPRFTFWRPTDFLIGFMTNNVLNPDIIGCSAARVSHGRQWSHRDDRPLAPHVGVSRFRCSRFTNDPVRFIAQNGAFGAGIDFCSGLREWFSEDIEGWYVFDEHPDFCHMFGEGGGDGSSAGLNNGPVYRYGTRYTMGLEGLQMPVMSRVSWNDVAYLDSVANGYANAERQVVPNEPTTDADLTVSGQGWLANCTDARDGEVKIRRLPALADYPQSKDAVCITHAFDGAGVAVPVPAGCLFRDEKTGAVIANSGETLLMDKAWQQFYFMRDDAKPNEYIIYGDTNTSQGAFESALNGGGSNILFEFAPLFDVSTKPFSVYQGGLMGALSFPPMAGDIYGDGPIHIALGWSDNSTHSVITAGDAFPQEGSAAPLRIAGNAGVSKVGANTSAVQDPGNAYIVRADIKAAPSTYYDAFVERGVDTGTPKFVASSAAELITSRRPKAGGPLDATGLGSLGVAEADDVYDWEAGTFRQVGPNGKPVPWFPMALSGTRVEGTITLKWRQPAIIWRDEVTHAPLEVTEYGLTLKVGGVWQAERTIPATHGTDGDVQTAAITDLAGGDVISDFQVRARNANGYGLPTFASRHGFAALTFVAGTPFAPNAGGYEASVLPHWANGGGGYYSGPVALDLNWNMAPAARVRADIPAGVIPAGAYTLVLDGRKKVGASLDRFYQRFQETGTGSNGTSIIENFYYDTGAFTNSGSTGLVARGVRNLGGGAWRTWFQVNLSGARVLYDYDAHFHSDIRRMAIIPGHLDAAALDALGVA